VARGASVRGAGVCRVYGVDLGLRSRS
jgi:hypothetical protein